MPFVIFEVCVFFLKHSFNWFVIHGGSRGVTVMVSFGIKFDIIFRKISVVLTCQLGV